MKKLIVCLFILFAVSCKENQKNGNFIIDECVGASFYYLDNQTAQSFFIQFSAPILNSQIDTTIVINAKQRVLIGQDAIFGSIPRPTDTFSRFALYTLVDGKKNIIYRQDPVQDAIWVKRKFNPADPDSGCHRVDYTLALTNDLLK
ncbi:MAG: hypothetical protein ABIN24_05100 [Dyadobacter sp.]